MRRGIGVVRVSEVGDRTAARLASPDQQQDRITAICGGEGIDLLRILSEIDISGGSPLAKRPGLRLAVEAVEAGEAEVIVVAYFDRLVRSLKVQEEVVSRIEAAGGRVLAADIGEVSNGTASQWLSASMLGMVAEYQRRTTAERAADAQVRAVAKGRPPFPLIPGLLRTEDGGVELDPVTAPVVQRAFEMRADGALMREIRDYLKANGIERTSPGKMLRSRLAVGEIRFGELRGECAALIDRPLFDRVQRPVVLRGRLGKSDRLLARLGVLRCGTCGGRMSANTQRRGTYRYPFYHCAATDCEKRVSVGAVLVEDLVVAEVKRLTLGIRGRASTDTRAVELRQIAERDQAALDAAIGKLESLGLEDEPASVERIRELRDARNESRAAARIAEGRSTAREITADRDWDDLTLVEQRALVRALIDHVSIAPGRVVGRVNIVPRK